ncbi:hypothetical protein VT03_24775 [Planctomyces sp. SH-PL14]|nr:hypothetical protein VT03_24775 [Planctomyces sp. SH-PL14]
MVRHVWEDPPLENEGDVEDVTARLHLATSRENVGLPRPRDFILNARA